MGLLSTGVDCLHHRVALLIRLQLRLLLILFYLCLKILIFFSNASSLGLGIGWWHWMTSPWVIGRWKILPLASSSLLMAFREGSCWPEMKWIYDRQIDRLRSLSDEEKDVKRASKLSFGHSSTHAKVLSPTPQVRFRRYRSPFFVPRYRAYLIS